MGKKSVCEVILRNNLFGDRVLIILVNQILSCHLNWTDEQFEVQITVLTPCRLVDLSAGKRR